MSIARALVVVLGSGVEDVLTERQGLAVQDYADTLPAGRNEGEGSSPASDEEVKVLETPQAGESGEDQSKLFESDYFRMHCMKVLYIPRDRFGASSRLKYDMLSRPIAMQSLPIGFPVLVC